MNEPEETFPMTIHEVGDWGLVIHGEALEALRQLPSESIDALCTDPPAGVSFMGRSWDSFRRRHNPEDVGRENVFGRTSATSPHSYGESDRHRFVEWLSEIMREVYRVMKPGAHGVVWSLPRTSHWTAWALEDAGFEIADNFAVLQIFGQGFPKSRNIAKDIDRIFGAEPEVVGEKPWTNQDIRGGQYASNPDRERLKSVITAPATDEAKRYAGFGSALKPAYEPWIVIRKPIREKNIALNVLKHGTGAMNLGACEVGRAADDVPGWHKSGADGSNGFQGEETFRIREMSAEEIRGRRGDKGRHPPNLLLIHSEHCVKVGTRRVKGCPATVIQGGKDGGGYDVGSSDGTRRDVFQGYGDENGMEEVELWACVPGCPVRELDRQSGRTKSSNHRRHNTAEGHNRTSSMAQASSENWVTKGHADYGGASRFFPNFRYQPKPSRSEKEAGLEALETATLNRVNSGGLENEERFKPVQVKNNHPTVKSIDFCRWLVRLVCPPEGTVLDCFVGSGTIGCAAGLEGVRFIGIEQGDPPGDDRYLRIAVARMTYWAREVGRDD